MALTNWKSKIDDGRETLETVTSSASNSARDAVAATRARVHDAYDSARDRAQDAYDNVRERLSDYSHEGRALAQQWSEQGAEAGRRALSKGKSAAHNARLQSQNLVAERPLLAVGIGIAAGVALGFLANQLVKQRAVHDEDEYDDEFTGG